jgi:hypothetical protein
MSDYRVEITETSEYTISIDTSLVQNENNVEVQLTSPTNVDIVGSNITTIFTSDISDFNSAVSGLIPVKNISAGSGIGISSVSGDFTVSVTGSFGLTSEEVDDRVSNLLVAGNYVNLNYNDLGNSLIISVTGVQPSGNYSLVGHSHNTSDITDFNSGVSGLLPSVSGSGYIVSSFANNVYTLSASGLQPSGNYSVVGHSHVIADVSGLQNALDSKQPSGVYASGIHYHVSSDITDFSTSVSGLLPSISGSGYAIASFNNNVYTISVTGVQPSGNYSIVGHTHSSSDITNFSSSVSGLLPTISNSGNNRILTSTGSSVGINAESNATFDGTTLAVSGVLIVDKIKIDDNVIYAETPTNNKHYLGINVDQLFIDTSEYSSAAGSGGVTIFGTNNPTLVITNEESANYPTEIKLRSAGGSSNKLIIGSYNTENYNGNGPSANVNEIYSLADYDLSILAESGSLNLNAFNNSVNIGPILNIDNLRLDSNTISSTNTNGNIIISPTGTGRVGIKQNNPNYTLDVNGSGNFSSGLYVNNIAVSISGHTHTSSDITDFNSAVSGLLPVKNIVGGSGINVSSLSGTYTVAVTGIAGLISEEVDDRVSQLLVEGTGVNLTYNDASGTLTIDNLHTEINVLSQEPQGFVNRTDSILSFDDSSRTFTIQPAVSGGSYSIYVEGIKIVKNTVETVVLGSGTALNYIHFDTIPPYTLHTKTTGFDFDTDVPIAFIHWNSDINQSTFFGEERHGIRMDSVTHKWIHNTFGIQYINGLSIGGYILLGNGSSNSHAQIDISDGVLYQEDIIIDITNDNGINSANEFVQTLNPIAYIPTYYHSGSTGQWVRDIATAFPVKYNATRAQYNLFSGGTWTTPNVPNDRFFAMWIVATNDINDPILAIVGQREDSSLNSAESNNNWNNINLTNIPTQEIRPLYRLIFKTNSTYTNTPKSSLQSILDIRVAIQSTVAGVVQNDHGSLFGLADDDHSQYVHIDNNRTISALHTFSNGLNAGGLINATSGNFTSLTVNSTGVSLVGHTHTSSDITDFNSSVSGLLPTINNSGNNRILTSTGSSTGINAESSVLITEDGTLNPTNGAVINDNAKSIVFGGNRPTALQIFNMASLDQNEASEASLSWSLGVVSSGSSLNYINGSASSVFSSIPSGISNSGIMTGSAVTTYRNAVSSYDDNGSLFFLIGQGINYGHAWAESTSTNTTIARGLSISPAAGAGTIENVYDIFLTNTVYDTVIDSSGTIQQGTGVISNRYGIYQESADPNYFAGSLTVGSGLSSPTPIFSLGTVSGNVSINYGIDKQIQTLTLNGTATNFIEGSGWDISNKSVDVFLEITATNTTTVTWTLIDDQYNAFPTFTAGKYLVLLRSMGTTIQGHYIGDKTN